MKDDKRNTCIFIFLIVIILSLFLFNLNSSKNKKNENIDRKVEYIFNKYTYDTVYNRGKDLFLNAIKLVKSDFIYEKSKSGFENIYALRNFNKYKKIMDYQLISNTLTNSEIEKYMDSRKIIIDNNYYYIENYDITINIKYIGSIIEIDSYDDKYIYFKSENYYCDNYNYEGILDSVPSCDYVSNNSNFTLVLENNYFRIYDLKEIEKILQ